ncbi:hypothetical protein V490_04717 [Pseudogymnoascus sp. VKM F-3557]|nr:hypothetical protein V490_04717 [Pseudogymnoascus sp. VKM F-3557]
MKKSTGANVNKACASCHTLKVRCILDDNSTTGQCQRCIKISRPCVFSPSQRRKQRKRTDTRVAELEQEMRALRSILVAGENNRVKVDAMTRDGVLPQRNLVGHEVATARSTGQTDSFIGQHTSVASSIENSTPISQHTTNMDFSSPNESQEVDVIGRGLVTMALAEVLYKTYVFDLIPQYPAVTFPNSYTAEELRNDRPILFLAVITAASAKKDPELYSILSKEILSVYATQSFINGEKSLELVQSMLVTVVWYYPPDSFDRLKFYENIHMAAVMALEIGLGSDPAKSKNHLQNSQNSSTQDIDITEVDKRRAILTCYLTCSGVSLSVRRPNMLRFNGWMSDCAKFLKESPDATLFDKNLVVRVSLQNIAEDISTFLSIEDPSKKTTFLDSRTQLTIRALEKRLTTWKSSLDPDLMNALYVDHPPGDFVPPYTLYRSQVKNSREEKPTEHYIDAIIACVTSGHDLLDAFLTLDLDKLRAAPVIVYVVVCYTAVVLTKLFISARDPHSELGAFVDVDSLAIDDYSNKVISHVAEAAGSEKFRIPQKFLGVLLRLQKWHYNLSSSENGEDEMIQPLMHLSLMPTLDSQQNPSSTATTGSMKISTQSLRNHNKPYTVAETRTNIHNTAANNSYSSSNVEKSVSSTYDASGYQTLTEPTSQFVSELSPDMADSQINHEYNLGDQMDTDFAFLDGYDMVDAFAGDMNTWLGVSGEQRPNVYDNGYNGSSKD